MDPVGRDRAPDRLTGGGGPCLHPSVRPRHRRGAALELEREHELRHGGPSLWLPYASAVGAVKGARSRPTSASMRAVAPPGARAVTGHEGGVDAMAMSRRSLLAGGTAAGVTAVATRAFAQFQPSPRYPDPAVQIVDQSFARYRLGLAKIEQLATGFRWSEGPVWFGDGRYLLWSDIPNNRIMRWDEETGRATVFRKPSNFSNGNTRDRQGRLVTCEHGLRRVSRTNYDGTITTVADRHEGKPLISPNDVVCKSDGSIWF